ncbi:MAG: Gfo/Idh/MocA family oxidoreductase [Candidatus Accumulibacter sp.]|nr:Gfo/Idh/MocA family oxidoreductase [Accumulibacter sp.]
MLVPDPVLVGRDAAKAEACARRFGIARWTTSLDEALGLADCPVYFNSVVTGARFEGVERALDAGKHVFCEKPLAPTLDEARRLTRLAEEKNLKNGVVMTDLWLPGIVKLRALLESGFFGRILAIRGDFGYWVNEGDERRAQRPSWNYRLSDGGGMVMDMMVHWHYLLDMLFGRPRRVFCAARTLIPERWDENDRPYKADADDMAMAVVELDGGALAQLNMSWCTRVRRDDLLVLQVDGTQGSAAAGIRDCYVQDRAATPTLRWSMDGPPAGGYPAQWRPAGEGGEYGNPFFMQWSAFLRHVAEGAEFPWNFAAASRGVEFVEACLRGSESGRWEALDMGKGEGGNLVKRET